MLTEETLATMPTIEAPTSVPTPISDDNTAQHVVRLSGRRLSVSEIYLEFLIDAFAIAALAVCLF